MFITVDVFNDHDRAFHKTELRHENIQAIGPPVILPSLAHPEGLACRKVSLFAGLWFFVSERDIQKLR